MGYRFRGTSLGEIDSPRCGRASCSVNLRGIGVLADAARFGGGVSNPAPPTILHRSGRRWALPSPSKAVPNGPSRFPLSPNPSERGGWVEIGLSAVFPVRRTGRSGKRGGCLGTERGADPWAPTLWKGPPRALPLTSSPIRVSGACFAYWGGASPPRTPPPLCHHFLPSGSVDGSITVLLPPVPVNRSLAPPCVPSELFPSPLVTSPLLPRLPRGFGGVLVSTRILGALWTSALRCVAGRVSTPVIAERNTKWLQ